MELRKAILERRSVRKFTDQPVDKMVLKQLLELSLQAPSWKNGQCWECIVVDNAEIKNILAEAIPETNPAYKCLHTAPYVVVFLADPAKAEEVENKQYYMGDVAMAFYAFWLACHDAGLATVCAGEIEQEAPIKAALSIPNEKRVYALAPVGYPLYQPKQRPRETVEQKVSFNQYGQKF